MKALRKARSPGEGFLVEALEALRPPAARFRRGQFVRWKRLMRNRLPSGPFVVVEALPAAIYDATAKAGDFTFREPLDLAVAYLDPARNDKGEIVQDADPIFRVMYVDGRRLELDE